MPFEPKAQRIECSAFSPAFKVIAIAVVAATLVWTWKMWMAGALVLSWSSSGWQLAAIAMMLYTVWFIIFGTTVLDADGIRQSWVWQKRVALSDLAYAKLIRVRGLEWLVAPRLYTKTFSNKLAVFYATDPAMLGEFERLSLALQAQRLRGN